MNVRRLAVLIGLFISAPALWGSLVRGQLGADVAFERTVIGLLVAAVGVTAIARLFASYAPHDENARPRKEVHTGVVVPQHGRRATDEMDEELPSGVSGPPSLPAPTGTP